MQIIAKKISGFIVELTTQELLNICGLASSLDLRDKLNETFHEGAKVDISETYTDIQSIDISELKKSFTDILDEITKVSQKILQIPDVRFKPSVPSKRKVTIDENHPSIAGTGRPPAQIPSAPRPCSLGRYASDAQAIRNITEDEARAFLRGIPTGEEQERDQEDALF